MMAAGVLNNVMHESLGLGQAPPWDIEDIAKILASLSDLLEPITTVLWLASGLRARGLGVGIGR
mgnify:CR=1 FL=1